jgi:hypothetical protein
MAAQGFAPPRPIKVVRLREATEAELKRGRAEYKRQGIRDPQAVNSLLACSASFLLLQQAGFAEGRDYHFDSEARGGVFSEAALDHLVAEMPPDIANQMWNQISSHVTSLTAEDATRGPDGTNHLTSLGLAKKMVRALLGLDGGVPADAAQAIAYALQQDGLPPVDADDAINAATSFADGGIGRLVSRLTLALETIGGLLQQQQEAQQEQGQEEVDM